MFLKGSKLGLSIAVSALLLSFGTAQAQDEGPFLQNSFGEPVYDSAGRCVITAGGAPLPDCLPAAAPEPAPVPEVSSLSLGADAFFDFDKSNLKPEGRDALSRLASDMAGANVQSVDIVGHTDSIGTEAYNQGLSERRAPSASDFMVSQGVNPGLITTRGMGELQPVAPNNTPEGRAQNRRVDITVVAEGAQ